MKRSKTTTAIETHVLFLRNLTLGRTTNWFDPLLFNGIYLIFILFFNFLPSSTLTFRTHNNF